MKVFSAASVALAGCVLTALPAAAANESVVYSFRGGSDGALPTAGVTLVNGTLYGTTQYGGSGNCSVDGLAGCGTVYSVRRGGKEKVLYTFQGQPDGANPAAGLTYVGGTFYGTTESGGADNVGTVFSVTTAGVETVIYSFKGGKDGSTPVGRLRNVGGTLYGTTYNGGKYGAGTVFSVTPAGKEKVLHAFGAFGDGELPGAGLIDVGGVLYGTTEVGGLRDFGTLFSVTAAGDETVVYNFEGGSDGANPQAADLKDVGGTIYGTTLSGGGTGCNGVGCGTVFAVTPAGSESVVYAFAGGSDGAGPEAGLRNVNGTLYGTTFAGGGTGCGGSGCGTVFSVTPAGQEQVLYAFTGGSDGGQPMARLDRELYGTTYSGGADGNGTVFLLTP